jgi:hypothetical protein
MSELRPESWLFWLMEFVVYLSISSQISGWYSRGSVVGWGTTLQTGMSPVRVPREVDFFSIYLILQAAHYGPGVDSASNRNEYQESSWGKQRPACRADKFAAICELNVWKCGSFNLSQP